MESLKLFEEWDSANEGMLSQIDVIGQESDTVDVFKRDVKEFLKKHAANPEVADDNEFLENLAKTYFDADGKKVTQPE